MLPNSNACEEALSVSVPVSVQPKKQLNQNLLRTIDRHRHSKLQSQNEKGHSLLEPPQFISGRRPDDASVMIKQGTTMEVPQWALAAIATCAAGVAVWCTVRAALDNGPAGRKRGGSLSEGEKEYVPPLPESVCNLLQQSTLCYLATSEVCPAAAAPSDGLI